MVTGIRIPIARLLGRRPEAEAPSPLERRRSAPYRCAGCKQWGDKFVFMSNGCNYCVPCARNLATLYRYRPVGRRAEDIKTLD